jgi:RNA polymerase sigma factor (sigma-70 family)
MTRFHRICFSAVRRAYGDLEFGQFLATKVVDSHVTDTLSRIDGPGDAELISAVRGGDVDAYGALFERHVVAARRLARQLSPSDADDLVSDAFAKVLGVLQRGGGPDVAFRAYLLTAVRRLHVDRVRASSKLHTTDNMESFDPGVPFTDTAVAGFENAAAAKAFSSLPERWQLVLWHTEVEGQKPAEVAQLLGMSPNSVSALAYRAREGLRQAFLNMHVHDLDDDNCRWTHDHLGGYIRSGLSRRDAGKVEAHLDDCRKCMAIYLELIEVNSNLAGILAPLLLGSAGGAYAAAAGGAAAKGGIFLLVDRAKDFVSSNGPATAAGGAVAAAAVVAAAVMALALTGGEEKTPAADPPADPPASEAPEPAPEPPEPNDPPPPPPQDPPPPPAAVPPPVESSEPEPTPASPSPEPSPTPTPSDTPTPTPTPTPPPPSPTPTPTPPPTPPPAPYDLTVAASAVALDRWGVQWRITVNVDGLEPEGEASLQIDGRGLGLLRTDDPRCQLRSCTIDETPTTYEFSITKWPTTTSTVTFTVVPLGDTENADPTNDAATVTLAGGEQAFSR